MPEPQSLPAQMRNRDSARLKAYADNLDFYNGKQWQTATPRAQRRLTFNYAKTLINKATSYLMLRRTTTVQPADDSDAAIAAAAEVELALGQVADQNALDQLDFDTELDCAVLGDGAYAVFWDDAENRVRVTAPDPAGIFAWHWPADTSRIYRVANRYTLDYDGANETLGALTTAAYNAKKNTIVDAWTLDTYQLWVNDTLEKETPNPYGFIPYILFPNIREPKQLWGSSDIPPIIDAQRELNRTMTQLSQIVELSGNPITVLAGVTESEDISVTPGAVWTMPADAKAYVLDLLANGGVQLVIQYIEALYRTLHDLGETPRAAFGATNANANQSGVALQLELDPLVKKVLRKRTIRTDAYRMRNQLVLRLLDQFTGTAFGFPNHTVTWGDVLPTDHDRDVANEVALVGAGVHSRGHAADQLGGVDDTGRELQRWLDEARQIAATSGGTPNAQP